MTNSTRTPARTPVVVAVAFATSLLSACDGSTAGVATPAASSLTPVEQASTSAPDAAPPAVPVAEAEVEVTAAGAQGLDAAPTGSTGPVSAEQSGEAVLFTAVRVAAHDGFDRVVFEYAGDGVPGYDFSYQPQAREPGVHIVELRGDTGLRGYIHGIDSTAAGTYDGPKLVRAEGTRSVTTVDVGVLYEGDQDPYIGITEEKPYRVTVLRDPTRVVIDVAH